MHHIVNIFNSACNSTPKVSFCTSCGNKLQLADRFCGKCGQQTKNGLDNNNLTSKSNFNTKTNTFYGDKNSSEICNILLNEDIKRLVFGWCHKTEKKLKIDLPVSIILIIATFCDIALFEFKSYSRLFSVNKISSKNQKQYRIKKLDDKEHGVIVFGSSLQRNTFKWANFNFVFKFKVTKGIVNLIFVPSNFNQWRGLIKKNDIHANNYQLYRFIPGYNYTYNQIIRVEIDMIKLCANISHKQFNTTMKLNGIDPKRIFCAFTMVNPFAEFEIIDQYWKKKLHAVKSIKSYEDSDDENILVDNYYKINSNKQVKCHKPSQISAALKNKLKKGVNYIGKCADHLSVYNRGLDNDIRPDEDNVICNQCNRLFKHKTILLYNCSYQ
eukprot:929122_1